MIMAVVIGFEAGLTQTFPLSRFSAVSPVFDWLYTVYMVDWMEGVTAEREK
jgi:hypothetical protein